MGIASLDTSGPTSSNLLSTGAADIRALRTAIRESFVNFGIGTDVVTATAAQINGAPNKAGAETISGAWNFTGAATFANPVVAPVGSVSAASFSFTGETNTGVYKRGGGQVGFAVAGAEAGWFGSTGLDIRNPGGSWAGIGFWYGADRRALIDVDLANGQFAAYPVIGSGAGTYGAPIWRYDPTGTGQTDFGYQVRLPDGSAAKPGVGFTAEYNSGFFRVGSGVVGLSLAGTELFTFSSTGLVGPAQDVSTASDRYATNAKVVAALTEIASYDTLSNGGEVLPLGAAAEIGGWNTTTNATAKYSEVTGTNDGRMTVATTGTYRVDFCGRVNLTSGAEELYVELRKNGGPLLAPAYASAQWLTSAYARFNSVSLSVMVDATAGDFFSLYSLGLVTNTVTLLNAHFTVQRVR